MSEYSHDNKGTHWSSRLMSVWTNERVEQLRAFRLKGLSATEIGLLLQVTRNAVIGKLDRLGIPFVGQRTRAPRPPKEPKPRKVRTFAARRATPAANRAVPSMPLAAPPTNTYYDGIAGAVEALEANECRWPLPDTYPPHTSPAGFCRAPIAEGIGQPYCPYHRYTSRNGSPGRVFVQIEGKPRGWKF